MPKILSLILITTLISLGGCSGKLFSVHKPEIQQGNALTEADVARILPGMTQAQVRERIGAPVLTPAFNLNRWDYVYYRRPADGTAERLGMSIQFKNGKVLQVFKNTNVMPDTER